MTGSERSITAWISVKMAVVPPVPSARVRRAAAVNTGDGPSRVRDANNPHVQTG
ncbi:MAG TPA: hypothetical protein VHU82_09390 [Vicinamibacterales bacterium]|nr:hypothetical protein [Vicinamibacterales bacterium]